MELPPTENKEVINNTKQYYADVIKNHGGNPQDLKLWVIGRQTYFLYISLSYDLSIESTDGCGRHNEVQDKLKYWQDRLAQVKYEFNESKSKNPISYISKTAVYKILDSVPVTEICDGCHGQGRVACTSCNGTGSKPCSMCYGSCKTSCTSCHGRGVSYDNQTSYDSQGNSVTTQVHNTCSSCYGKGEINCTFCNGFGTERCHACSSGKVSCHGCAGNGHVTKTYSIQSVAKPTYQVFSRDAHDLKIAEISKYFSQSNTKDFLSHIPVYHLENGSFLETQENGNQIFYYQGSVSVADIKIQYVDHSFEVVSVNDIPDIGMYPLAEHVLKIVNDDIQKFSDNIKSKSIKQIKDELGSLSSNPIINKCIEIYFETRDNDKTNKSGERASDALKVHLYKALDNISGMEFSKNMSNNLITIMEASITRRKWSRWAYMIVASIVVLLVLLVLYVS